MNQQTTTQPRREFRPVEQLTGGEHVNHQLHQDDDVITWRVGHVAPYTNADTVPMVAVVLTPAAGGEPELIRERRGVTLPLATDREVAQSEEDGRRFALATALCALAGRILNGRLSVPSFIHLSGIADSREQLDSWAKAAGAEIRMSGRYPVASWELGGLSVRLQGEAEPEPGIADEPTVDAPAGA